MPPVMSPATRERPAAAVDRRWLILAVVAVAQLMVVLDSTIVNIALPSAQHSLGFSNNDRQWVVTAYALAFGSLLLMAAGSATCSAASGCSSPAWPGSRSPQPSVARPARSGCSSPPGRYRYLSWRYTLYVNLVFAAIAITGALVFMRSTQPATRPRMDWPGTVLASAGLFLVLRRWVDPTELPDEMAISAITLAELSAGPHQVRPNSEQDLYDEHEERACRTEALQRAESEFDPVPFDAEAARIYGRVTAAVVTAGRKPRRRIADLMIAATALRVVPITCPALPHDKQLPVKAEHCDAQRAVERFIAF